MEKALLLLVMLLSLGIRKGHAFHFLASVTTAMPLPATQTARLLITMESQKGLKNVSPHEMALLETDYHVDA